jgi:catechol 2,3-dioxygenase-like lactoylglutathione lyase family enzyme
MDKLGGMPGLRGIEHFGLTVPDIDEACEFFEKVIGCEVLFSAGAFADDESDWMTEHLNVNPRAKIKEYRYVRCGNGTNLEIFQYEAPDQEDHLPKNSDIGGHHIAFYVDDIDAAIKHLKANGVRVLGEPTKAAGGPTKGLTWCYFLAPWGLQLEIVSCEQGIAHDHNKEGKTLLWHPKYPKERLYDLPV